MMISREQLLAIDKLELSGIIDKMDADGFGEYCNSLDKFIAGFPKQENKLKIAFGAKDYNSVTNVLLTISDSLTKIYANGLARTCRNLPDEIRTLKYELAEANLISFLASISSLSIAIQMTQYNQSGLKNDLSRADEKNDKKHEQKSILAVDDVSLLLNTLKLTLQNTEYKFTGVTSGIAALKFLETHKPDLFILDIEMPQMNGYELAKKIRACGQTAPIIFLTGNATTEYVLKAIQVGATDFIVKPINRKDVLEKIEMHII